MGIIKNTKTTSPKFGVQYLYVLLMLSFTFQFAGQIPIIRRHYLFWVVGFGFALYYAKKYLSYPAMLSVFFYLFLVWFNFLIGDEYFSRFMNCIEETLCFIVPSTLLYYLYSRNDRKLFLWIFIAFSVFLVESSVVSFMANLAFPNLMRLESNKESMELNAVILEPFIKIGLSSYSLPHALPIIIPPLIYLVKKMKGIVWLFAIAVLVSTLVLLYASSSTTALLLGGLALIFSFIINSNNVKAVRKSLVITLVLVIPLLSIQSLQLSILDFLQSVTPAESNFSQKVDDIKSLILYGDTEGTVEKRTILYDMTFQSILTNPILGTNDKIGGHSGLFDRWATLGLLGLIPLLCFVYHHVKFTIKFLSPEKHMYYYTGWFAAFAMMSAKGMFGWDMWFSVLVMLPGILWWSDSLVIKLK